MHVQIEDGRVRQNVLFFLQVLALLMKAKAKQEDASTPFACQALINKVNGEIFFIDLLPDPKLCREEDWKSIEILCEFKQEEGGVFFALLEGNRPVENQALHYADLTPLAYQVMSETLHTVNRISRPVYQACSIERSLAELTRLQIAAYSMELEQDIIRSTWRPIDRWRSEEILSHHPYGSFLFRQDEYAAILEKQLQEGVNKAIHCYTLSFSAPQQKICDLTIVQDGNRWLVYDDDPQLGGVSYASIGELLNHLRDRCQNPLFA